VNGDSLQKVNFGESNVRGVIVTVQGTKVSKSVLKSRKKRGIDRNV
jgi:hypothetical protein